jgi:hypothetical protein
VGRLDSPLLDRMVFLVGAQRSGTNWLQRMLAAHPSVVSLPSETHLFTGGMDALAERFQHGVLGSPATGNIYMDRDAFLDAARDFCDRVFAGVADRLDAGACRVVERSPNHVEQLELIGAIYPDAWFLHIVRDGRDVARSLLSQPWGPTSVEEAAQVWARSMTSARAAAPALTRYREVHYERLLADPAGGMRDVFEWLGLGASTDDMARVEAEAGVSFNTDAKRPDIGTSKWVGDWSSDDLAAFDDVAGDVLRELGYPDAEIAPQRRSRPRMRRPRRRRTTTAPPRLPLEAQQRTIDALCAALAHGDAAVAAAQVAGNASAAVEELMRSDPAPWGRQVRGDVHVGGTSTTVVLSHELDGRVTDRVVIASFDNAARITSVTVYRYPGGQTS